MADNNELVVVSKDRNPLVDNLAVLTKPENIQKYVLGYKKNGCPRAIYDVVKDYTVPKKKKKKNKKHKKDKNPTAYSLYVKTKKGKKKKKDKYWHL